MEDSSRILRVEKTTENRFLNMYDLHFENRAGRKGIYHIASRSPSIDGLKLNTHNDRPDGVIIYALYGEAKDRVVLVRQYRFSIDRRIYEFPAGLVEPGESYAQAGIREMKEETGLTLYPVDCDEMYTKAFFTSIGMSDECCATIYGCAKGEISAEGLEENEDLEVVLADRAEVRRILKEECVSSNCAYLLMHFLCHEEEDPFRFLKA